MEIKKGTLVVVKPFLQPAETAKELLGMVRERSPYGRLQVEMIEKIWAGDESDVIPLCEGCDLTKTSGENLRKQLPDVIVKLTLILADLQQQVEKLQRKIEGDLMPGLGRTQEHLHEHELKPH